MKRVIDIVVQIIIIVLLVLTIVLPKIEFSSNENRYLQKFPVFTIQNVLDGKFMMLMSDYVADHFPFRENFLSFKTNLFKSIGVKRQNDVYYASDDYLIEEYKKPVNSERIVRVVNRFIDNNSLVKFDFMLVPTSAYVLNDKISSYNLNYDEGITLKYFKENLKANYIDVVNNLMENKDQDIYYRTDHHWTTLGAYYGYTKYCMENNITPNEYLFEIVNKDFYGTLYSKVIDNSVKPDIIMKVMDNNPYVISYQDKTTDTLYNDDYLKEKDKYSYFLNGNQSLMTISNENVLDKEILVIKDSYANSFIPLIASHYSKIHVIDPRYYKKSISKYIEENNITNVLFLYNVGTIDEDLGILSIN